MYKINRRLTDTDNITCADMHGQIFYKLPAKQVDFDPKSKGRTFELWKESLSQKHCEFSVCALLHGVSEVTEDGRRITWLVFRRPKV